MRVYRDTRFSKGGEPYKTNVGIQFRHELGRDIHAPGFYVHIAPGECFWPLACGVRTPRRWAGSGRRSPRGRTAGFGRDEKKFRRRFSLDGGSLKRPPRGFAADHPCVEDLKRTDFIGVEELEEEDVRAKGFLARVAASFAASGPFMRFLCDALKAPF